MHIDGAQGGAIKGIANQRVVEPLRSSYEILAHLGNATRQVFSEDGVAYDFFASAEVIGNYTKELVANEKTKVTFWLNPPGVEVAEAFAVSIFKSLAASEYKAMFISPVGCLNFLKVAPPLFDLAYTTMSPPSHNKVLVYRPATGNITSIDKQGC